MMIGMCNDLLIYDDCVLNLCEIIDIMSMGILRDIGLKVEDDVAGKIAFF